MFAGVSGGADSMCMLTALLAWREEMCRRQGISFDLAVIHVEHGLRGEASLEDARFVEAFCRDHSLSCEVVHEDIAAAAKEKGLTLEEAGRQARYRIFEERCAAWEKDHSPRRARISVAHQMEDQAETVLFHLARGSGLAGLAGMHPVRGRIIRPLLAFSREEIEAYLRERAITWRMDATNVSPDHTRNRIRHQVLPLFAEQVNAQSVRHICEAAAHADEALQYMKDQTEAFSRQWVHKSGTVVSIDVPALRKAPSVLRMYVLRDAVLQVKGGAGLKDIQAVHLKDMEALCMKGSGKRLDLPGLLTCERRGTQMLLYTEANKQPKKRRKSAGEQQAADSGQ